MTHKPRRLLVVTTFAVATLLSAVRWAAAQDAPTPATPQTSADPGPEASAEPEGKPEAVIREQTIYIPYEKLRKTFEKEGRGVFLPYEKFRELWDAAREATRPADKEKPPLGAVITKIDNEAEVAGDVIRVTAHLSIDLLSPGWHEVPLRLPGAAITRATLNDRRARIVTDGDKGYKLLLEKKEEGAEQVELTLEYAKAITKAPGQNSVAFEAPRAPVSRWRVRIPEAGVKVDLHPLIAATEVTSEAPAAATAGAAGEETAEETTKETDPAASDKMPSSGETVILAFVGAAPEVRISWTPKAEGATGLEALASVQAEQQVSVTEGVTRTHTKLVYTISRAELGKLSIEVPADQKVVNVLDANVRQWSVNTSDERQTIDVQLFEPAEGQQTVTVELEKFTDEGEEAKQTTLDVPVVKALGVGRQQGVLVVRLAQGLRAEATHTSGLMQLDAAELPQSLGSQSWSFSYRYAAVPFELQLGVEKVRPRILVDSLVETQLLPERLTVDVTAIYTVQRAGVFRLEWDVPAGYEVRYARGRAVAGAEEAQVDAYHLEGEDKTRLVVNLARKALGRVGLVVRLEKDLQEPDLVTPTGNTAEIGLPIPRVVPETVRRASGRLVVYAPASLRVNPTEVDGLRSISFQEAFEATEPIKRQPIAKVRPVLAFAFGPEPTSLTLSAERRKPQVTIAQLLDARIEDGVVKYDATFHYEILYSGVKSLRIDVPQQVSGLLRTDTESIRDQVVQPQPDDVAEGYVAWSFSGETELIGGGQIKLLWEEKVEKLDVGGSVQLTVPRLVPIQTDRAWGQIVLAKAETIDVGISGEPVGLRGIDPQHDLMPSAYGTGAYGTGAYGTGAYGTGADGTRADGTGVDGKGAAKAFEFHDDWSLVITATRYELEEIKHTSIERAVLRMLVTRADKTSVQALYRLRSAEQRLAVRMPTGAEIDAQPKLNGRPVTLEVGQDRQYFVPLVDVDRDDSFLLEFRYTLPGEGMRLEWPVFLMEPAVQQVHLCVYLPEELDVFLQLGPWTKHFGWGLDGRMNFKPLNKPDDDQLLSWIAGNVELPDTFAVDGRLYVFSAMRPRSPGDDPLRLVTVRSGLLDLIVVGVVLLAGVLLLPMRAAWRVFGTGGLAILLIVLTVFAPIFAWHLLDGALAGAVTIVAILWVFKLFFWTLPRACRCRAAAKPHGSHEPPHEPGPPHESGPPHEPGPPNKPPRAAEPPPPVESVTGTVIFDQVPSDTAAAEQTSEEPSEQPSDEPSDSDRNQGGKTDA